MSEQRCSHCNENEPTHTARTRMTGGGSGLIGERPVCRFCLLALLGRAITAGNRVALVLEDTDYGLSTSYYPADEDHDE